MSFVTHLDASSGTNRRDSERRLVNSVFSAWSARGAPFMIIVHDISETGFRAEFASELHTGDEVRLRLGGAGYVPAVVVWREGWDHGCRFLTPILPEEVKEAMRTLTQVQSNGAAMPSPEPEVAAEQAAKPRKGMRIALILVGLVVIGELALLVKTLLF